MAGRRRITADAIFHQFSAAGNAARWMTKFGEEGLTYEDKLPIPDTTKPFYIIGKKCKLPGMEATLNPAYPAVLLAAYELGGVAKSGAIIKGAAELGKKARAVPAFRDEVKDCSFAYQNLINRHGALTYTGDGRVMLTTFGIVVLQKYLDDGIITSKPIKPMGLKEAACEKAKQAPRTREELGLVVLELLYKKGPMKRKALMEAIQNQRGLLRRKDKEPSSERKLRWQATMDSALTALRQKQYVTNITNGTFGTYSLTRKGRKWITDTRKVNKARSITACIVKAKGVKAPK